MRLRGAKIAAKPAGSMTSKRAFAFLALILMMVAAAVPSLLAQKPDKPGRKVVFSTKPEYPAALRQAQIGGLVRLSATVEANGTVTKVQIRGGNPVLAESAVAAVMK